LLPQLAGNVIRTRRDASKVDTSTLTVTP
jgi:hypothetical protein